jgi:hypothetical protein
MPISKGQTTTNAAICVPELILSFPIVRVSTQQQHHQLGLLTLRADEFSIACLNLLLLLLL